MLVFVALPLALTGCQQHVRYGFPPHVSHLDELTRGVSNQGDVLLALGEPRGNGEARFTPTLPPRDIWFYELVQADGRRSSIAMLLVFFDKGVYDGYLWFSSAMLLREQTGAGSVGAR